jgi:heat shock protein HslJ
MKSQLFPIGFALLVLIITSCGPGKQAQSPNSVNTPITEKYWKLVEINTRLINPADHGAREPHIILKAAENRIVGNGGCNSFFGRYELPGGNKISIKSIGATKMACQDMSIESELFKVLETADSFTTRGDTLLLSKGNTGPLAKFIAVDMH